MKRIILNTILFGCISVNANILVTTDTNKRVLLKENGTWTYIEKKEFKNSKSITYNDDNIKLTIKKVTIVKKYSSYRTQIVLDILSVNQTKIINFNTHSIWGYDEGSDVGGTRVKSGLDLYDSFGNDLKINSLSPKYYTLNQKGLRPNQHKEFKIIATDYPLETSKYIILKIPRHTFGNIKSFKIKIPSENIIKAK
jgi:hypothetical protein